MAHRLLPRNGEHLEPSEIVRRLRAEFDHVEADRDAGTEHLTNMLRQFQKVNAPKEIFDAHRAMLGQAISIVVSDREDFSDDYLSFTAMPGEGLFIGYCSGEHEEAAAPLLDRACSILGYEAKVV